MWRSGRRTGDIGRIADRMSPAVLPQRQHSRAAYAAQMPIGRYAPAEERRRTA